MSRRLLTVDTGPAAQALAAWDDNLSPAEVLGGLRGVEANSGRGGSEMREVTRGLDVCEEILGWWPSFED